MVFWALYKSGLLLSLVLWAFRILWFLHVSGKCVNFVVLNKNTMKKLFLAVLTAIAACGSVNAQAWPDIQPEMKAGTRWWWMGSAVDTTNLRKSFDEFARAGIGSVEITPIYGVQGNEANEINYLSPQWMQMLHFCQTTGDADGVLVDMNQGTGWPFGGPEVKPEHRACKVTFLVDTVAAGQSPVKALPPNEAVDSKLIAESRCTLADGREEVIRAFQGYTRQQVKRAAPGGEGYVIDHFNHDAVADYLAKFDRAFGSAGVQWPHNFFNDSYEVYGANWTPSLFDEFERRRGYRLQDRLPQLLGLVDDDNQVLCDYRETLGELLLDNFTRQWVDWAHQRDIKIRNQAHGSPANLIDVYAAVDVPEIEGFGLSDFGIRGLRNDPGFTRRNDSDVSMLKYASSAAHVTGKPLTSSETFTWLTEHFRTSLSQMKPDLDLMLACGVNHVFYHGTCYSPFDDPWPGWKFYASVDMSPTNSIWRDAPALMDYISRSQSMLQQGRPDNDFLVYLPVRDMWRQRRAPGERGLLMQFSIHDMARLAPDFIHSVMQIDSLGFDSDYISDNLLMTTRVSDGLLTTAAGTPYKALIVPGSGRLTPRLKAHLDSLSSAGANIIYGMDMERIKVAAEPEQLRTDLGLRVLRRKSDDGYIYFIANLGSSDIDSSVPLAVDAAGAAWFDAMTGDIYRAEFGDGRLNVKLRSGESRLLRTYDSAAAADRLPAGAVPAGETYQIDLTEQPWTLTFVESTPEVDREYRLDGLKPWTSLGDSLLNRLAGTGVYTTKFEIPADKLSGKWTIDLGDVRESARVYVNGQPAGIAWAAPFALSIGGQLRPGENEIRIEVTNLPANRIADMDRRGVAWRKYKDINIVDINYRGTNYAGWQVMPSGLNSRVVLHRE